MGTMIRLTGLDVASSTKPPSYLWRLKAALNDAKALALAEPADAVIKTGTSTLLDVVGHKYRDFIFDEIIPSLRSVHKIETVTADDHLVRRANALVPALATRESSTTASTPFLPKAWPWSTARRNAFPRIQYIEIPAGGLAQRGPKVPICKTSRDQFNGQASAIRILRWLQ